MEPYNGGDMNGKEDYSRVNTITDSVRHTSGKLHMIWFEPQKCEKLVVFINLVTSHFVYMCYCKIQFMIKYWK